MIPALTSLGVLLACAAPVAVADAEANRGVSALFVSEVEGPVWALLATFSAGPGSEGEEAFAYAAQVWVGDRSEADAAILPAVGGRLIDRQMKFKARAPITGWPERDHLAVVWHGDGGLEVRAGSEARLTSEPVAPGPVQLADGEILELGCARAELRVGSLRQRGVIIVEMNRAEAANGLLRAGTLLLADGRDRYWLARLNERRWFLLAPGQLPDAREAPLGVTWLDGRQTNKGMIPTAIRLERGDTSLMLERVDALRASDGEAATPGSTRFVPLAGGGFAGERNVAASALLLPPLQASVE